MTEETPVKLGTPTPEGPTCLINDEGNVIWGSPSFMASVLKQSPADPDVFVTSGDLELSEVEIPEGASENALLRATRTPVTLGSRQAWLLQISPDPVEDTTHFRTVAENAPIALFFSGAGLRLEYVNGRFCSMLETSEEEVLGTSWLRNLPAAVATGLSNAFERALRGEVTEEVVDLSSQERSLLVRVEPLRQDHGAAGFIGTLEDVTEKLAAQTLLSHQAGHDALTGLPNRANLWKELERLLRTEAGDFAVLFVDLDNFKLLNDSLGHDIGDELLIRLSHRLQRTVRRGDMVARFGGDEFILIGRGIHSEADAALFARRILDTIMEPVDLQGGTFRPSASIGVALAQPSHREPQDIVRDSDIAMYEAKKSGKNQWALCDDEVRRSQRDRLILLSDLRAALDSDELHLCYQPVVDLGTSKVEAVEAFSRWDHPERGLVPPSVFIPLAEEGGLSEHLSEFVLTAACKQMRRWIDTLGDSAPKKVSVNISIGQITDNLLTLVGECLQEYSLLPENLQLEITEATMMSNREPVKDRLVKLSQMGVDLSIDDFGTGIFSLSHLRNFPIELLKIDRSFVSELSSNTPASRAAVEAVVALAASLGMRAVAEGVETQEQLSLLRSVGCTYAQGYLFQKPVSADDLNLNAGVTGE